MITVDIVEYARSLLRSLPGAGRDVRSVAGVLQRCTPRICRDGEVLCTEGETGDTMFFLVSGAIRVERRTSGDPRLLSRMRPPAVVGHMSLVDNSPRSGTLVAEGPTQVLVLDRSTWVTMIRDASPDGSALRRIVMASLSVQLCRTTNLLNNLLPDSESGAQRGVEKDTLRSLAGSVAGWNVDTQGLDDVNFVKPEYTRRNPRL